MTIFWPFLEKTENSRIQMYGTRRYHSWRHQPAVTSLETTSVPLHEYLQLPRLLPEMKGGSNGEFWKKSKKRPQDNRGQKNATIKVAKAPVKRSFGESSTESESSRASEIAWERKLHPDTICKRSPKDFTVSIAIPSSVLKTAKSTELKTYLVGQIARACAIHEIDEIIVYMDIPYEASDELERGPGLFICRLLQYLECPPYMRTALIPAHDDLKFASLLPLLHMPHQMSSTCTSLYREGVVITKPVANGSLVDVGLPIEAFIEHGLQPGTRVTVKLLAHSNILSDSATTFLQGEAISPLSVRQHHGLYWGYQTRLVSSFSEIFSGCPYSDSDLDADEEVASTYDLLIGYSNKGEKTLDANSITLKPFRHALVVFGGTGGIEACVEADKSITTASKNADCLFDHWLDLAPSSGSRTVRTEEALLIGLSKLTALFDTKR